MSPRSRWGSVTARDPRQAAELDAFLGQRLGFLVGGLAVDAALVAFAVMAVARLLGELRTDMLAGLLDLLAELEQRLAHFLGHVLGEGCHLLLRLWLFRRGRSGRRRRCRLRRGLDILAAAADARRHDGARHLAV